MNKLFFQVTFCLLLLSVDAGSQIVFNKKLQLAEPSKTSSQIITGIAQDQYGFIWLSSMQGLLQYDGSSHKSLQAQPA